jgi:hypothetical protein
MKALVNNGDFFISEMELIYDKAEQSRLYRRLYRRLPAFKLANYGLVMALNLNILFSPKSLRQPFYAIVSYLLGGSRISEKQGWR